MVEVKTYPIGHIARRCGVATSTLRFYETNGLIASSRNSSGHRRYPADVIRRVGFIRVAQRVGLSLADIADALASLPDRRTPTTRDWERLARSWRPQIDDQIALLERLRDDLDGCIGCGCLSLNVCALWNPDDVAATTGSGPRYLLSAERPATAEADQVAARS